LFAALMLSFPAHAQPEAPCPDLHLESEHSYLSSAEYAALLQALVKWIDAGERPSPRTIAALCETHAKRLEGGCHFDVDYRSPPLSERQYPSTK
jgi:hypothetical protein